MANQSRKKKNLKGRLTTQYRLVLVNDRTFEEASAVKLTFLNVLVATMVSIIVIFAGSFFLISGTDLRYLIPGKESKYSERITQELLFRTDSIYYVLERDNKQFEIHNKLIKGEVEYAEVEELTDSINAVPINMALTVQKNKAIQEIEEAVQKEENFNKKIDENSFDNAMFFVPVNGSISQAYDPSIDKNHRGIDVAAKEGEPVKAILAGVVMHAEWSSDTGYNVIVQHKEGLTSIYKHNGKLSVKQGQRVSAGEVIASVGNSGEFSSGPHLHFELWFNEKAVNPSDYIDFQQQ